MNKSLPIEASVEKAKREILSAINQIGHSYELPSLIVVMIVEQIVAETKLNSYSTIVANYDISLPADIADMQNQQQQKLANDDTEIDVSDQSESASEVPQPKKDPLKNVKPSAVSELKKVEDAK